VTTSLIQDRLYKTFARTTPEDVGSGGRTQSGESEKDSLSTWSAEPKKDSLSRASYCRSLSIVLQEPRHVAVSGAAYCWQRYWILVLKQCYILRREAPYSFVLKGSAYRRSKPASNDQPWIDTLKR